MTRTPFPSAASAGGRLRFQLTPLLDLLLIIVFAQFLEVRETADAREAREAAQFAEQTAELEERTERLRRRFDARVAELGLLEERLRSERAAAVAAAGDAVEREDRVAAAVARLLDLPAEMLDELDPPPGSPLADDLNAARRRAARMRESGGEEIWRFWVAYEELLKRAEIWTLHVSAGGRITLSAGDVRETFQLERRGQDERAEEFADRLFATYKMLPQPKGLVVTLVSYDRNARAGDFAPVLEGLPEAVRRLGLDQEERTRFEFAVLGITPDPFADDPPAAAGPPNPDPPPRAPARNESPSR